MYLQKTKHTKRIILDIANRLLEIFEKRAKIVEQKVKEDIDKTKVYE